MPKTELTEPQRDALEYYARRDEAPDTVFASHEPKIGTRVALIRRGLLLPICDGRTRHELTEDGWAAIERIFADLRRHMPAEARERWTDRDGSPITVLS